MPQKHNSNTGPGQPTVYQIRIKGHLDPQWTEWFEGLTLKLEDSGDTLLTGPVVDQAALHGLLKKIRDSGLTLISFCPFEHNQTNHTDFHTVMDTSYL